MLTSLCIENVVLIDRLDLTFQQGLCVLTGETGAGKSILLDALGLALGGRASANLVRPGCEKAKVSAVFDIPSDHPVNKLLCEQDFDVEDELVLRRVVTADGKSKAFLNDSPISASLLKTLSKELIEIHGQFDQILQPSTHRMLLDQYGAYETERQKVISTYGDYAELKKQKRDLEAKLENQDNQKAYLESVVAELDDLNPQEKEEESLLEKRNILQNQEKVIGGVQGASHIIHVEKGLQDLIGSALTAVEKSAKYVPEKLDPILGALNLANEQLMEADALIQSFLEDQDCGEETLESVEDRLHALRAVSRKHGCLVAELPSLHERLAKDLHDIEFGQSNLAELDSKLREARSKYLSAAEVLSQKRAAAAHSLAQDVEAELKPLKLEKAKFKADPTHLPEDQWSQHGIDHIAFQVQTNPGLDFGDIASVASGGERSRLMLALKVILASQSQASILIFDEIDSGVGGAVATAIGDRMARLGKTQQVLAITHSPQVASCADHHFYVQKAEHAGMTTTSVTKLSQDESLEEVARMLSGDHVTDEARAAAQNLVAKRA